MKIVAVEKDSVESSEFVFEKPLVTIGRTPENDIIFDKWRMVSRAHAVFRFDSGNWLIEDAGSSYGTFVNGSRIQGAFPLSVGNSVQFGESGPILHIIWLEGGAESVREDAPPNVYVQPQVPTPPASVPFSDPSAPEPFAAHTSFENPSQKVTPFSDGLSVPRLEFIGKNSGNTVELDGNELWIGRDSSCDVVLEPGASTVSRRHAVIRKSENAYFVEDNNSFNGTLVNEQQISEPVRLFDNDRIQFGRGGPILRFLEAGNDVSSVHAPIPSASKVANSSNSLPGGTMVFNLSDISSVPKQELESHILKRIGFTQGNLLTIGRNESNDIQLDGLQISNRHAVLRKTNGGVYIEDSNSTNGVYVNGVPVSKQHVTSTDSIQIGAFVLRVDENAEVTVFDTRAKARIDCLGISKEVKNRNGGGKIRLLDDISLTIQPNEFIGLLGASGAGKSTFMDALNGTRPATSGKVYINNLDLYSHIDSLKQSIGYVPQDDIIHRELTVYRTLYYVAKLRLSSDISRTEINRIIEEVLDVTGLEERRNIPVRELSGGQRKRVSIAVELITKPSVIFLDEPTSGLDPITEERIMKLFRQIAESGRTVILTTHAMENVKLFDKIVVLMRGKLVFYGAPSEALAHFNANDFIELFEKLEAPQTKQIAERGEQNRALITEEVAEEWRRTFVSTREFQRNISEPLGELSLESKSSSPKNRRLGIFGGIKQWATLSARYSRVLSKDKLTLLILFLQAPLIGILVYFAMGAEFPRDFAYFSLSLCAIWFGTSLAAREIVRERPIYKRERMVNLRLLPYLGSKFFILGLIVSLQCIILWLPLKFFDLVGLMPMPGYLLGIPQLFMMLLTAAVGISIGLCISGLVRTSEMATGLIPLILIPQIVFSGLIGVPTGISKVTGMTMPAAWSFDSMKRFSGLDTLEPEGSIPGGKTNGQGLFKYIDTENDKIVAEGRENIKAYEKELEDRLKSAERRLDAGEKANFEGMPQRPKIADPIKVPADLSGYVTFLHPWMGSVLNPLVLVIMFLMLFTFTLLVLRLKDVS